MAFTLPFLSVGTPLLSPRRPARVFCRSTSSSNREICTDIFDKASPSVVFLSQKSVYQGLAISKQTYNTGFFVSDAGHILTCSQGVSQQLGIVDESGKTQPKWHDNQAKASFLNPEIAPLEAVVVAAIPHMNLAVLKLKHLPQDLDSKALRFSKIPPKRGDLCFSIGHSAIEYTIRTGVVSSPIRYPAHFMSGVFKSFFNPVVDGFYAMEVDMNVGPGFTGAPLLSPDAEVTGMIVGRLDTGTIVVPWVFCEMLVSYALNKPESHPKHLPPFSVKGISQENGRGFGEDDRCSYEWRF